VRQVRIEIGSSFSAEESYDISEGYDEDSKTKGYYLSFKQSADGNIYTLRKGRIAISEFQFEDILRRCMNISINLAPEFAVGLDGTKTKVAISLGFNRIELEWWSEIPKQWKPVMKLIEMVKAIARDAEQEEER
jgi:hypothetical protein